MFGQNPVRKKTDYENGLYRVQSVFYTIQGEGPFVGQAAVFVRLAGCCLKCSFCDTDFETGWNNVMSTEALGKLISSVRTPHCRLVVITGGEPMLQNLEPLFTELPPSVHVQIETSGAVWKDWTDKNPANVSIVVSPKTPAINRNIELRALAYKYIVQEGDESPVDGLPKGVARPPTRMSKGSIYVQPMDLQNAVKNAANIRHAVKLVLLHGYRLSVQVHKAVGVE